MGQALKLVLMAAGYENQAPTGTHWASGFYDLAQREGLLPSGLNLGLDNAITRLEIAEITASGYGPLPDQPRSLPPLTTPTRRPH